MGEIIKGITVQLTPEQERVHSDEAIEELKTLSAPLVEWLRKYHGPHTEIHISWDYVQVTQDDVGLPFPYSEK